MRKKMIFICLPLLLLGYQGKAQPDKESITAVIELYFDGWASSDTSKIGKAMHSSCQLKYFRDGNFGVVPRHEYLSRFKAPHARDNEVQTSILFLDITGNIAQAKAKIETPSALFIDYFNLIKTNEGWYIVDKVSTRTDKK
ncbi:MAG TPA: nuclear transport factor 2 family protein [Ferruginibacter sp.]|jgi:hypothetical protein|nr:nuclear transport factor 2 family protein [Ferruginibacter sp.]